MGFNGPKLGPKEAEKVQRAWTNEQKHGHSIIPKQAGNNKGATQAGHRPPGAQRPIHHTAVYREPDEDTDEFSQ